MCEGCWEEYGSPTDPGPWGDEAIRLIRQIYNVDPVGGNLHIVLDDFNCETENVLFCKNEAPSSNHPLTDDERRLCNVLLQMTEKQRASAIAKFEGFC